MTVGVGYLPTPEGRAALGHAIRECTVHQDNLVVVVTEETAAQTDWAADLELARASLGLGRPHDPRPSAASTTSPPSSWTSPTRTTCTCW